MYKSIIGNVNLQGACRYLHFSTLEDLVQSPPACWHHHIQSIDFSSSTQRCTDFYPVRICWSWFRFTLQMFVLVSCNKCTRFKSSFIHSMKIIMNQIKYRNWIWMQQYLILELNFIGIAILKSSHGRSHVIIHGLTSVQGVPTENCHSSFCVW